MEETKNEKPLPIKDAKGNILKEGDKVKILISEFNYPAGMESIITITTKSSGEKTWAASKQGITTYLDNDRAKKYEKVA